MKQALPFVLGIILSFLNGAGLNAQTSQVKIYGKIIDAETLIPIENANVILIQTSIGSTTDVNGDFRFEGISDGTYSVQASMTGYKTERKRITLRKEKSTKVDFLLQVQTYLTDSVSVTAEKEFRSLMYKPYTEPLSIAPSISKVTHEKMNKEGALTVIDAMNYIPGGFIETRGRQVKQFFSVRGQKYPYPAYALNGVWQQEFEELPYFFSTSDIEEIVIVRSSAALLTGLSGMAGLIDIKTRDYSSPVTNLEIEYGSFNSIHSHLSTGSRIGNFSYSAGAGYDMTDGPSGRHAGEKMADFSTQLSWQPSRKINLKANIFYLDGKRQLTLARLPADKKYLDMVQSFDPYKAILTNLKFVYRPNEKLSSELQLFYSLRNPLFIDEVKATTSNEKDYEWGVNFMESVTLTRNNILRFGGLYDRWLAPNGKRFYTGKRCDTETLSGVIVDEHHVGNLTLDAGVRLSRTFLNDYGAFNIGGEGSQFKNVASIHNEWESPVIQTNAGASYKISEKLNLYFNASAGQVKPRPGTLTEDFTELSNEARYKIDMGVIRKLADGGKLTFNVFNVNQKNAIALSGKTYIDTTSGELRELYVNRDQKQTGMELEFVSPRLFNLIEPFVNITLMDSKKESQGKMVVNKENPVIVAAGGIYAEKKGIDINILCKYVSGFENNRFAPAGTDPVALGDFFTVDLKTGYTFKGKIPLNLYIRVKNLTDVRYSTVVGYPDFGRMIYFGLQAKFI